MVRLLTYTLLFLSLHLSGQGLLIEQNGQLIRFDTPTGTTDSLVMFEFDPVTQSRLALLSDTSDMQLRWSNDTAYVEKWYDVSKRDSLVQATEALQPRFDFSDGSVRFDSAQFFVGSAFFRNLMDPDLTNTLGLRAKTDDVNSAQYVLCRRAALQESRVTFSFGAESFIAGSPSRGSRIDVVSNQYYTFFAENTPTTHQLYRDLLLSANKTPPSSFMLQTALYIGVRDNRTTVQQQPLQGNIQSIILFDFTLNNGQRILTNKYLQK